MASVFAAIGKWAAVRAVRAWWRQLMARPIMYPNRRILEREAPLGDRLHTAATIDALWLHGGKAINEVPDLSTIQRLLLPDPGSSVATYLQIAMPDGASRSLADAIKETTRRAASMNISVRWLKEFPGYTLLIGDGRSENSWCQIELAIPTQHGANDPTFEITKKKHPETIDSFIQAFNKLWDSDELSRKPNETEYEDGTRQIPQLGRGSQDEEIGPIREGTPINRGSGEV